jgi:lipopolysaccharide export system protein LptA
MAIKISGNDIIDNNRNIIDTGNITINAGIITASAGIVTYYGDGSKLTGISAGSESIAYGIIFGL